MNSVYIISASVAQTILLCHENILDALTYHVEFA